MSTGNIEKYPYEIKNVSPQEAAQLADLFPEREFFRFGPKGYLGNEGLKDAALNILNMEIRPTDTIVVAHQRSVNYLPFFEHLNEAWKQREHPNMLFLFYEELSKDLSGTVRRVADFLGKTIEEPDISRLCEHLSFENFKKSEAFVPSMCQEIGLFKESKDFVRRGKAGGWRDYFDSDMAEEAEQWIAKNLGDTDLSFPVVEN